MPPYDDHAPDPSGTVRPPAGMTPSLILGRDVHAPPAVGAWAPPGFVIEKELGRGGMGIVYLAHQAGLNRPVALKLIKADDADSVSVLRFLAEAEAMAVVRHPNVAQVYQYGEHAGRPFLALEYCDGGSLYDRIKDTGRFAPAAAATLLAAIADGVQAAHALGIVHRDLKPANVLFDAAGVPKVTDFGLAKRNAGDHLTNTDAVMGTPAYMSPEQARGQGKFADPRMDVWALGVILYELLAGRRPFAGDTPLALLQKVIETAPADVRSLAATTPRDLGLICNKCLRKEAADRYPTGGEVARDLRRFLAGKTIRARPVSAPVKAWKWVRRNPLPAALAAVAGAAGVGLAGSLVVRSQEAEARAAAESGLRQQEQTARADAERLARENADLATAATARAEEATAAKAAADAELARANQVTDYLTGMFRAADPLDIFGTDVLPTSWEKEQRLTARDFLDRAADRFAGSFRDQPLVRARLLAAVGNSYTNLGLFPKARPLLDEAFALRTAALPADHPDRVQSEFDLGKLDLDLGDTAAAADRFRRVLAVRERTAGPLDVAAAQFHLGYTLTLAGRAEAEPLLRAVIATRERHLGPAHQLTISAHLGLAAFLLDQARSKDILAPLAAIRQGLEGQPDGQTKAIAAAMLLFQQGMMAVHTGDNLPAFLRSDPVALFRKAVAAAGRVLPKDHLYLLLFRWSLARELEKTDGRRAEALAVYADVWAGVTATVGPGHPRACWVAADYAEALRKNGKPAAGRALFAAVDRANVERFGPDNLWQPQIQMAWATFEAAAGDPAAAVARATRVRDLIAAGKLASTRHNAFVLSGLLDALDGPANPALADDLHAANRRVMVDIAGPDSNEAAQADFSRGLLYWQVGRPADAVPLFERADRTLTALGANGWAWLAVGAAVGAGEAAAARGEFAAAAAAYRRAVDRSRAWDGADYDTVLIQLAGALGDAGDLPAAAAALDEAVRVADRRKAPPATVAEYLHIRAVTRLAAGDRAGYAADVRDLIGRATKSTDPVVADWAVHAAALAAVPPATVLPAVLARAADFPSSAGLYAVRTGQPLSARDQTILAAGTSPLDALVLALAAVAAGDRPAAARHLAVADVRTAAARPSPLNPYGYGYSGEQWAHRAMATLLAAEVRAALAPVESAPPPRPVSPR